MYVCKKKHLKTTNFSFFTLSVSSFSNIQIYCLPVLKVFIIRSSSKRNFCIFAFCIFDLKCCPRSWKTVLYPSTQSFAVKKKVVFVWSFLKKKAKKTFYLWEQKSVYYHIDIFSLWLFVEEKYIVLFFKNFIKDSRSRKYHRKEPI